MHDVSVWSAYGLTQPTQQSSTRIFCHVAACELNCIRICKADILCSKPGHRLVQNSMLQTVANAFATQSQSSFWVDCVI